MRVADLLAQITRRDAARSEATLQADIRQLVLIAPLSRTAGDVVTADLESPVGVRRWIDLDVGSCLIEAKRDLAAESVLPDAVAQLVGYLATRQTETGCRYVGNDLHARLAARGAELEAAAAGIEVDPERHFAAVRRDFREFIAPSEAGRDVEALVEELLS